MAAWYSKRAKKSLDHKFRAHIPAEDNEIRVFGNYTGLFGHCQHVPPRYVYNKAKKTN